MDNGHTNMDNSLDSDFCPAYGKGAIVLTPTNYVARVMWVQEPDKTDGDPKVSVEYLEYHAAYNVYNMSQLTLIAKSADRPKFDVISEQKLSYQREQFEAEQRKVEEFVKSGKVKKLKEVDPLTKALGSLSPEQLARIMEILK